MAEKLTIKLLGGVRITLGDKPVAGLPSQKAQALLIYLACRQRPFPREVLADLLWDDRPQEQALANLRALLSGLRRHLKPYLLITRQTVAFDLESNYWLDTLEFSRLCSFENRANLKQKHRTSPVPPAVPVPTLHEAMTLYQGNFLEGFYIRGSRGFQEWARFESERLQQIAIVALHQLSHHYLNSGAYEAGIPVSRRLLQLNPYSEAAHRMVMLLLARSGQKSAALTQYQDCRQILTEEFGATPSPETISLFERIRAANGAPVHNLPPQSTLFISRETEIAQIQSQLALAECRLLTILGPGGIGKTRLAVEVVRRLAANRPGMFLNGIRFVPLSGLGSAELLDTAVLDTLGHIIHGQTPLHEQLLNYLRGKEILLVLDNYEHLLSPSQKGAVWLADVLKNAPLLTILVTSRERLNLVEEWVFDLEGLDYPEDELDNLSGSAAQLFVQNASRLERHFSPNLDDRRAIARICRLLAGTPLGIELASAWVRSMSCTEIAESFENSPDFLTASAHNIPARHRSLRAVFDHSWNLLSDTEQTVVCALSAFSGPFTKEAAENIIGFRPPLASLADKTFLQRGPSGQFNMHDLLQQFAEEHLAAVPEAQTAVYTRFSRYYTKFLADRADSLSKNEPETMAEVGGEISNIRTAWQRALSLELHDHIAQGVDGLLFFYYNQNWVEEGGAVFEKTAAALAKSAADGLLAARVDESWAEFEFWRSNYEKTHQLLTDCLPILERFKHNATLGRAYNLKGTLNYYQGNYQLARKCFQAGLDLFREHKDYAGMAHALNGLANVSCDEMGDYETARQLYQESLSLYRRIDHPFGIAKEMINKAALSHVLEEYEQAKQGYRAGIPFCRQCGHEHALAIALGNLAQILIAESALDEAADLLAESLALKRKAGDQRALAFALNLMGELFIRKGDCRQAQENLEEGLAIGRALASPVLIAEVSLTAARLYADCGQPADALTLLASIRHHITQDQEIIRSADHLWGDISSNLPKETVAHCQQKGEQMALTAVTITLLPSRGQSSPALSGA